MRKRRPVRDSLAAVQRWSVPSRFFAGLTLVVVLVASDRLGGLGRSAPTARQTGRPLVFTAIAQDLSATAPRPRRSHWSVDERQLRASTEAVAVAPVPRALPQSVLRTMCVLADHAGRTSPDHPCPAPPRAMEAESPASTPE